MKDEIDFSALDPSREKARWAALVESTVARAVDERERWPRATLRWSRVAVPVAAIALAAGVMLLVRGRGVTSSPREDAVLAGASPDAALLLTLAGGRR